MMAISDKDGLFAHQVSNTLDRRRRADRPDSILNPVQRSVQERLGAYFLLDASGQYVPPVLIHAEYRAQIAGRGLCQAQAIFLRTAERLSCGNTPPRPNSSSRRRAKNIFRTYSVPLCR